MARKFLDETNPPTPNSIEVHLRRAVPSFTVEVRRRPRLATKSSQGDQSSVTKTRPASFESESRRVDAATFAAKTPNQFSGDGAASNPKGRILQSLVPEKLPGGALEGGLLSDPTSSVQKPPSGCALRGMHQTSQLPSTLEASDLTSKLAVRSSVPSVRSS